MTAREHERVGLVVLGAQRAGSTTIHGMLDAQPGFVGAQPKEPHFFSLAKDWRAELSRYEACFPHKPGAMRFDASTSYAFNPRERLCIWRDLYDYNPDLRFVYVVRDPLARIRSAYGLYYQLGYTDLPIDRAVLEDRMYVDASRYSAQVLPFIKTFGRDRVLLLDFADLERSIDEVAQVLSTFLGRTIEGPFAVDTNATAGRRRVHRRFHDPTGPLRLVRDHLPRLYWALARRSARPTRAVPHLEARTADALLALLEPDIRVLEELMGKDLTAWRAPR